MWAELLASSCVAGDSDHSLLTDLAAAGNGAHGSRWLEVRSQATGGGQGRGDRVHHTCCTHTREAVGHPATCWRPRGAPPPRAFRPHITPTPSAIPRAEPTPHSASGTASGSQGTGVATPAGETGFCGSLSPAFLEENAQYLPEFEQFWRIF